MMMMKLMIQRSHLREKQIKGNRRSQRKDKRSQKQGMLRTQVDNPDTPSQEKQIKENRKSRRQGMRSQKQKKMEVKQTRRQNLERKCVKLRIETIVYLSFQYERFIFIFS
ncbi:uncharacterized protein LOC108849286 [Raphanus sativus]|uniref:Uncharacterized protein LOC108829643 isoform X1 n=1 Tax=Raphanus sativus TaxID=3726 RepID=A0A6J0LGI7_RAPSA|nr:uncharacterized protein LOC108829643 isoform X1 [Raphanus sativus]XP_056860787.1 uncharacterized protein LOC108849286 [Raphanus sativus]